jgi:membrane protein DedA with SNARE-associated domain
MTEYTPCGTFIRLTVQPGRWDPETSGSILIPMSVLIHLLVQYKLLLVFPAAFVLGPTASLACGFLLRLGTFDFLPLYLTLMAGELTGDILWYWIGHHYGHSFIERFGKYVSVTDSNVETSKRLFRKYHSIILLLSKLTTGFGFSVVTLFTAGFTRIPFSRYLLINIFGQFFWTAGLLSVGYFTTHFYLSVQGFFAHMSLVAVCIALIASLFGFGRYIIKRLTQSA